MLNYEDGYDDGFRNGERSAREESLSVADVIEFMSDLDMYDRITLIDAINRLSADIGFKAVPNG